MVKNMPEMWETWVQSLGQEDPLEKGMAAHSSILACNSMDRRAWQDILHHGSVRVRVAKSRIRLRDKHFSFFLWGREVGGSSDNKAVQEGFLESQCHLLTWCLSTERMTRPLSPPSSCSGSHPRPYITFSLTDSPCLDCEPWALFISGSPASGITQVMNKWMKCVAELLIFSKTRDQQ